MIKVELSKESNVENDVPISVLDDVSIISKLFNFAYENDDVHSLLKDKDKNNHKEHIVSVLLTNDIIIKALNKEYRSIDSPTDVLSFPQDDEAIFGDIVISIDTLLRNAEELKIDVNDEYLRLLLHSFLHLLGYDHSTNDFENEQMLSLQEKLLVNFKKM